MTVWPWIGLGAAIVIGILLFATDWLRSDTTVSRWKDPTWFAWVAAAAYMLHNVEEYGIDFTGTSLAFPSMMTSDMGVQPPESFFLVVNIGLVWIAGPLAALATRRMPVLVLAMPTVELVNSFLHIPGAIALRSIGAGFVTALLLFVPIAIWAFVGFCGKDGFKKSTYFAFLGIGVIYHLGFVATIVPLAQGVGPNWLPAVTMALFTAIMLGLWYWMAVRVIRNARSRETAAA
ncbi:HXXEE domain-containing protein [Janibacter indicus]|uniref:HXXEE domain-containing protein n=1 Tax=Janibacter indicus TaxID=857417 RepID=UPI003D9A2A8A